MARVKVLEVQQKLGFTVALLVFLPSAPWPPSFWFLKSIHVASHFLLNVVTRGLECLLTLHAGQQSMIFRNISYNEITKASLMFGILTWKPFLKLISRPNFRKSWRHSVWKYCRKVWGWNSSPWKLRRPYGEKDVLQIRGTQIKKKKSSSHLEILGTWRVTRSKFHSEGPQILGASVRKGWSPGFVYQGFRSRFYGLSRRVVWWICIKVSKAFATWILCLFQVGLPGPYRTALQRVCTRVCASISYLCLISSVSAVSNRFFSNQLSLYFFEQAT